MRSVSKEREGPNECNSSWRKLVVLDTHIRDPSEILEPARARRRSAFGPSILR